VRRRRLHRGSLAHGVRIRTDPLLFAILPGHAMPEVEDVVSKGDRFQVVRKHEEEEDIARATDPRA